MKNLMMAIAVSIMFGLNGQLIAQHGHSNQSGYTAKDSTDKVSKNQSDQLQHVIAANVLLKDAFVDSDPANVKRQALAVNEALATVNGNQFKGKSREDWETHKKALIKHITEINKSNDLGDQREHYAAFNETFYNALKVFGTSGQEVYYQYCPMALNDKGAYWLSNSKEIRNPYFGSKMLKCGSNKEVIK